MKDHSVVLRWEIDNATARFATGKVESEVFHKGGFEWTITAERLEKVRTAYTLKCAAVHSLLWKCEVDAGLKQLVKGGQYLVWSDEERVCFNENSNSFILNSNRWSWVNMTHPNYLLPNDKVTFEVHINIISSERGELPANLTKFAAPNEMSNVILKIGDEKLHVSKELLSVHSPVFKTMFFGDFAEKGKEEVELNDVVYEEFRDLLYWIYHETMHITDRTVVHILSLADRFQMENVLKQAKMRLIQSKGIDVMTKLLVADQYNLVDLKDQCFKSFTTAIELLKKIQKFPEFDKLSADMKVAICEKIRNLKQQ